MTVQTFWMCWMCCSGAVKLLRKVPLLFYVNLGMMSEPITTCIRQLSHNSHCGVCAARCHRVDMTVVTLLWAFYLSADQDCEVCVVGAIDLHVIKRVRTQLLTGGASHSLSPLIDPVIRHWMEQVLGCCHWEGQSCHMCVSNRLCVCPQAHTHVVLCFCARTAQFWSL